MDQVKASIGKDHYKTSLETATNFIIADEPVKLGGAGLGFSPTELLASALATCTCVTLRMYADRKEWPLEQVDVAVSFERDQENGGSSMVRLIELHGNLSLEQRERLLQIANQCFIHKTLTNPINISTQLV